MHRNSDRLPIGPGIAEIWTFSKKCEKMTKNLEK